jgi:hypothetical protein
LLRKVMKMKLTIKPVFLAFTIGATLVSSIIMAEAAKCSPCQAAKSVRDAAAQSIRDAQAAALAAGQGFTRDADLEKCGCTKTCRDAVEVDLEKCGCSRTTRDEMAANIDQEKCGCSRTTRDEIAASIDVDPVKTIAACCAYCAMPGSLGCQGENKDRCNTCLQGRARIAKATAAARAAAMSKELDQIPSQEDGMRAPREALTDPCPSCTVPDINCCGIDERLYYLNVCCSVVNQRLIEQGEDAKKCCKKLHHGIHHVTDLIGDPADSTILDIPLCEDFITVVDTINAIDVDMMTWLKNIYYLLYLTYNCACDPCTG